MRLRSRQHYQRMVKPLKRYTGQWILVDIRLSSQSFSRLGITVTRKFGTSCQRNRFKRLARETFRHFYPSFKYHFDVLIRPRSRALEAKFSNIQQEFNSFMERAHFAINEEQKKLDHRLEQ